jgi:hypothetical protein
MTQHMKNNLMVLVIMDGDQKNKNITSGSTATGISLLLFTISMGAPARQPCR